MMENKALAPAPQHNRNPRITLAERRRRLQQWLSDRDTCRIVTGCELSVAEYERAHGWTPHTIERLMKDREMLEAVDPELAEERCRAIKRPFYVLEVVLAELIKDVRSRHLSMDTLLLKALAHDVYTMLHNRMGFMPFPRPAFGGSWVNSFKKTWRLNYHQMKGEAGSVDLNVIQKDVTRLKTIISEYPLDDVYNADETGLFLQAMSPWTRDFDRQTGSKSSSSHVSILLCVNATGTDKRNPFILSTCLPNRFKADKGAYLRSQVDVLPWKPVQDVEEEWGSSWRNEGEDRKKRSRTQRPGYMNADAFLAWLRHTQHNITAKDPVRKILLLVDNCKTHTVAMRSPQDFPNIRIEELPPNSISATRPLDAGIIADFKRRYRHLVARRAYENSLLVDTRAEADTAGSVLDEESDADLEQDGARAVGGQEPSDTFRVTKAKVSNFEGWELIAQAWNEVKPMSIRDCFAHVPIFDGGQKEELRAEDGIDPDIYDAITDVRQDITARASMMDQNPRETPQRRFPGISGRAPLQPTQARKLSPAYTRTERDYYTRLSTILDGSTFLNDIITERRKDRSFMTCFDVEERTVPLDELFLNDDDSDDEDYGLDSTTMPQPRAPVLSPDTHSSQKPFSLDSTISSLAAQSTSEAADMLVLTKGATFVAPGTIIAPHGSIVRERDLQTRNQSYSWSMEDLRSSDISDPDIYQYEEDEHFDEPGSKDERIDVLHRAAELLQGDEYKAVRHALDVAAEKLVSPAIGFASPEFTKEYHSRERKRMEKACKQ